RVKEPDRDCGNEYRSRNRSSRVFCFLTQRRCRLVASEGEDRIDETVDNPGEPEEARGGIERLRAQTVRTALGEDDHCDESEDDDLERETQKANAQRGGKADHSEHGCEDN